MCGWVHAGRRHAGRLGAGGAPGAFATLKKSKKPWDFGRVLWGSWGSWGCCAAARARNLGGFGGPAPCRWQVPPCPWPVLPAACGRHTLFHGGIQHVSGMLRVRPMSGARVTRACAEQGKSWPSIPCTAADAALGVRRGVLALVLRWAARQCGGGAMARRGRGADRQRQQRGAGGRAPGLPQAARRLGTPPLGASGCVVMLTCRGADSRCEVNWQDAHV